MKTTRRNALRGLVALPIAVAASRTYSATPRTPSAAEGPFYPTPRMRFNDDDSDLVRIRGAVESAGGEIILLNGRVLDRAGHPARGARVEIWQCDANGRYTHTRDTGGQPRDPAFQGFGHHITGPTGAYEFRTIKPVPYPGRTPHIHVKVQHGRHKLTTQFYIADHESNKRDWLYQRLSKSQQNTVSMEFESNGTSLQTTIDIRL